MDRHNPPTDHTHRRAGTVRRLTAAAVVTAVAIGSAACGGDDDVADPADTTAGTDTTMATDTTDVGGTTTTTGMTMDTTTDTTSDTTATTSDTTATTSDVTDTTDAATDTTTDTTDATGSTDTTMAGTLEDALTDTLSGEGVDLFLTLLPVVGLDEITDADEVTLLVPSDEAFLSIGPDEIAAIIEDPSLVREVLESHVVESELSSSDLSDGDTITPVSGEDLTVTIDGDTVMIGQATVVRADIRFDGGVIHVIDDVIALPDR